MPTPPSASEEEAPPRPGLASRRLPGAIQELVATRDLPPDTPGLAELAAALPASWWMLSSASGPLEQVGWPLRHDAALACRACASLPGSADRAELVLVRGWLAGTCPTAALVAAQPTRTAAKLGILLGPMRAEAEELALFAVMAPEATEEDRRAFLAARRLPPADTVAGLALEAAYLASDGWLMYYAHRGLASPAAIAAAVAIRTAVRAGGAGWAEVVGWARELVGG